MTLNTPNPEINVEQLMLRIREEVARRKAHFSSPAMGRVDRSPVPVAIDHQRTNFDELVIERTSPRDGTYCLAHKGQYSAAQLLAFDDDRFLHFAYLAILRREPDPAGEAHYRSMLNTGRLSKAEVLGHLRFSPEGRTCNATIPGIAEPWTPCEMSSIALARFPVSIDCVTGKEEYSLAELLNYDEDRFVRCAYLAILRREPDVVGQEHYSNMLQSGQLSKTEILGRLRFSPEGKTNNVKIHGLLLPFVVQSVYRVPVLGYGVAMLNFVFRLPTIIKNRVFFENQTLRQQREQTQRFNAVVAQIENALKELQRNALNCDSQAARQLTDLNLTVATKVSNEQVEGLAAQTSGEIVGLTQALEGKASKEQVEGLAAQTSGEIVGLTQALEGKASKEQVEGLAAQTSGEIVGLTQALEGKASKEQVEGLAAQTSGEIVGLTQALEGKASKEQVEGLAAQTSGEIVGLTQALEGKASKEQVEGLAAQTSGQIVGLTQALEAKARSEQIEALVARTDEQIFSLTRGLELKADNERLTQLTNHLVELVQQKAEALKLVATEHVEALATLTNDQFLDINQKLEAKAPTEQVKALAAQTNEQILGLNQTIDTKAQSKQVEELAARTGEQVIALARTLEIKADKETLTQLTNQFAEMEQRKVDTTKLAATEFSLVQAISQKAESTTFQLEIREIQRQIRDHKSNILDQQRRLSMLLEEARKRLPEPISNQQIENMVTEEDHLLDAFYVSFEDRFRGTREDIKRRVAIYLPVVNEVKAGTKTAPVLDIGCGRGEWLELLRDQDLNARGVDLNRVMVRQCQELGLEVMEADAITYLRNLKSNSLGAVTGLHIIEHISFKRLIALFDEVLRVLRPGGVAIFETPNPENLLVGACNFYYDPTHLNPLPPEPMRFVMDARGFGRIEIMRLHPRPESDKLREGSPQVQQVLNSMLFGEQDYALVAYKS
jgi:SAM-dependent methyltransferase